MKRILLAGTLALSLGACTTTGIGTAISFATTGVANPVTKNDLYAFENTLTVAFAGLKAYKTSCAAGAADANCRANIALMQAYTRKIPPALVTLRGFVKNNDQVNANLAYNTVMTLFNNFKAIAVAANVQVQ